MDEKEVGIYLYGLSETNLDAYRDLFEEHPKFNLLGSTTVLTEAIKKVSFLNPDIVLIDLYDISFLDDVTEFLELIKERKLNTYVVLAIKKGMTYNLKKILQLGIKDFVYSPLNEDVLESIYTTYINFLSRGNQNRGIKKNIEDTKVISFFSPKGGVGKTYIALNVAAGLAHIYGKKVLYLDLSFPYSDLPAILNVSPNLKNLYDLIIYLEDNPHKDPNDYILSLSKLKFSIILPPRSLIETSYILSHIAELKQTINIVRSYFDITIIDLSPRYYDQFLPVFELANDNFGIVTAEGSTAILLNQFKEEMLTQGISLNIKVIYNRKNQKVLKPIAKEWRYINQQGIFTEITDDPIEASLSNNLGEFTILRHTTSKTKKDLVNLVKLIIQNYYE